MGLDVLCLKGVGRLFKRSCKDGKGTGGMAYCVNYLADIKNMNGTSK